MNKIFYFLLAIFCVVMNNSPFASPVDLSLAQQIGQKFITNSLSIKNSSLQLVYTDQLPTGQPCCYVFNVGPRGFVIVAADDRMNPILAYSTESCFTLNGLDEGPAVFLDAYRCDLEQAIQQDMTPSEEVAMMWKNVSETGRLAHRNHRGVGPLLTSTWHQTQLYNDQCPDEPEGYNGHVKVGCVATAMSQLMYFWQWPKTGTGSHSYYCYGYSGTEYGTLSANFGEAEYRFELMPSFLDYTSPQTQVDAIALLCFHAGVSVEMEYGANASGAYSSDVLYALPDYFRYSSDIRFDSRDYYSDDQWINLLKTEFNAGRPVYYSGYSYTKGATRGGHAFICDGYDENDFMHFET